MIIRVAKVLIASLFAFSAYAADEIGADSAVDMNIETLVADNPRKDRRDDRQEGRDDNRDDRQDCRDEEGAAGKDKRDCKQEERREGDGDA